MSFDAKIYRVMIASPSDVSEARGIVRRAIESWNATSAINRGIVLLPVGWETASAPALGDRAQSIINDQLGVCDVLIGVFWTRLGTPTGGSASGTVEEIDRHLEEEKLVMLYFSKQPVVLDSIDTSQLQAVRDAEAKYKKQGLVETFDSLTELEAKIFRHLSVHMNVAVGVEVPSLSIGAGDGGAARAGGGNEAGATYFNLSSAAKELLKEAVKDGGGHVMKISFLGGMALQTNGRNFVPRNDPRERAKWEAALNELVDQSMLEPVGYKGEIFKVTAEGYRIGDTLT